MANLRPKNFVLRCYGRRLKEGKWYGVCLELNLAAEAESPEQLRKKLYEMIVSYIDTVIATDDKDSIPYLLERKAPLYDWAIYYLFKILISISNFPNRLLFKESIPFHLAHNNR